MPPNYLSGKILCGKLIYKLKETPNPIYSLQERTSTLDQGCHGNSGKIIEITSTTKSLVLSEVTVFNHLVSK